MLFNKNKFHLAILGAAIAAAFSGQAHAQSNVTIYGIVDSGIEMINHASTAGGVSRISSGNLSGSRIGFRGTEDLGGGLKAVFVLESGYSVDTGASLQSNRLFGRQSYVGLRGEWGALMVGRQNSLMLDWMSKYNTMDNATWSSKVHDGAFSDRIDNAIKYVGKFGAFEGAAYYSTGYNTYPAANANKGELADTTVVGRQYGFGGQYKSGGFKAGIVYDQKNGQSLATRADTDKHLTFGASYKIGATEILGGYLIRRQNTAPASSIRTDLSWIGAKYRVSAPLELSASLYHTDVKRSNQDPTSIITMVRYSLSKRTDLYLINSYVWNKNGSNLGVNGFGSDIAPGSNQFGTMAGIRHTF